MIDKSNFESVIFIGPYRIGKTTIAKMLSKRVGIPYYSLDEEFWDLLDGMEGINRLRRVELQTTPLIDPRREEYNAFAVTAFLNKHNKGVFDFGSIHSVYTVERYLSKVSGVMQTYPNVVLLLPTQSLEGSLSFLIDRSWKTRGVTEEPLHKHFLSVESSYQLATIKIYTRGRTAEQTCQDVIEELQKQGTFLT